MSNRMKGKPDFDEAEGKPGFDAFRSGGGPELPSPTPLPAAAAPTPIVQVAADDGDRRRENKTVRMRVSFSKKLREQAFHRSVAEGRKVSESDVLDDALAEYFSKLK